MNETSKSTKKDIPEENTTHRGGQPLPPPTYSEAPVQQAPLEVRSTKISKIKLAFLYLLIGGLVVTALISVAALLAGSISQSIQSAFITTSLIVVYSAMLLVVVLADTRNELGRSILPTTIFVLLTCQMITNILGVWEIISGDLMMRFVSAYFMVMAGAFLVDGALRLSLKSRVVKSLSYGTSAAIGLLVASLLPWILAGDKTVFGDLYYRVIAAISIVIVTMVIITAIMNRITVYQRPESRPIKSSAMAGGLVAIVATVGTITAMFMMGGIAVFVVAATNSI